MCIHRKGDDVTDYVSSKWDRAALVVVDLQEDFLNEGVATCRTRPD